MTDLAATGANAAQIEFWNGEAAKAWIENAEKLDTLLGPLSQQLIERAAVRRGERVLDVGCGCGATTLELAGRGALSTGVDISGPMLARARDRAATLQRSAEFVLADAASHRFEANFDLLFSRFGVMFFADPVAAFTNLRSALNAKGRLSFLCWQHIKVNPWMVVPMAAARPHLPEPAAPPDPRAPGPFAFADPDYVRDVLQRAGFGKVSIEPVTAELELGRSVEDACNFVGRVGPLSRPLAEVDADVRRRAMVAVEKTLAAHADAGVVRLGASCWIVTA
jgi:SAM-dependent methyltransferase